MSRNAFIYCKYLTKQRNLSPFFRGNELLRNCCKWRTVHRHSAYVFSDDKREKRRIIEKLNLQEKTKQQLKETKNVIKEQLDGINENVFTIPNGLCLLRIGMTPILAYYILINDYKVAFSLCVVAGATDMLDGYIARNFPNQKSVLGSLLDPFADKFLVATLFATLTYTGLIPVPLTALIVLRDGLLVSGAAYLRFKSLPEPRTLSKYFNFKYATVQVSPTNISKVNTGLQLSVIAATLGANLFGVVEHPMLQYLFWITAATTVASGLSYVWCNNTYKFIRKQIKIR